MNADAFELDVRHDGPVLRLRLRGRTQRGDAAAIAGRVQDVVIASGAQRVLIDVREVQSPRLSLLDVYELVRTYRRDGPRPRTAVIEQRANRLLSRFHETVAVNLGFSVRFFENPEEAEAWLMEGAANGTHPVNQHIDV